MWTHLERMEGAIGTRGPGETQLETDRRLLNKRISDLKRELDVIEKRKQREVRARTGEFVIGLVGYTNAGKSTLLNRLTGSDEFAADMPFATLDTRTRRWTLPDRRTVLLSDTVGFLQRLPHHLVASFHATLEETLHADLLLHVVDASNPDADHQMAAVDEVLTDVSPHLAPDIVVFNKVDRVGDRLDLAVLTEQLAGAAVEVVHANAHSGEGLDTLTDAVVRRLDDRSGVVDVFTQPGMALHRDGARRRRRPRGGRRGGRSHAAPRPAQPRSPRGPDAPDRASRPDRAHPALRRGLGVPDRDRRRGSPKPRQVAPPRRFDPLGPGPVPRPHVPRRDQLERDPRPRTPVCPPRRFLHRPWTSHGRSPARLRALPTGLFAAIGVVAAILQSGAHSVALTSNAWGSSRRGAPDHLHGVLDRGGPSTRQRWPREDGVARIAETRGVLGVALVLSGGTRSSPLGRRPPPPAQTLPAIDKAAPGRTLREDHLAVAREFRLAPGDERDSFVSARGIPNSRCACGPPVPLRLLGLSRCCSSSSRRGSRGGSTAACGSHAAYATERHPRRSTPAAAAQNSELVGRIERDAALIELAESTSRIGERRSSRAEAALGRAPAAHRIAESAHAEARRGRRQGCLRRQRQPRDPHAAPRGDRLHVPPLETALDAEQRPRRASQRATETLLALVDDVLDLARSTRARSTRGAG